jgi:GH15 family glucan-1,4-alpha-glucosidase
MRYGIVGNCKIAALVSEQCSIDWLCMPRFDSPSVFARILDSQRGGHFAIQPVSTQFSVRQRYLPYTNVLETVFDMGESAFRVFDYVPRYRRWDTLFRPAEVHRVVQCIRGTPSLQVLFSPQLDYARGKTTVESHDTSALRVSHNLEELFLYTNAPTSDILAQAPIVLDKTLFFVLSYHEQLRVPQLPEVWEALTQTTAYWESWSTRSVAPSRYYDEVLRSALTLKLLCYEETGAIVAAMTTSLPETIGEERNWDYRFCWLRDSSFTLDALKSLRYEDEATSFIKFLLRLLENRSEGIQIMYGIDGRPNIREQILPHLAGYQNSRPVRIGNAAYRQKQHDIYGEILHSLYLYFVHHRFRAEIDDELWSLVRFLMNTTMRRWKTPDAGLWEYRGRAEHFTFSKVLAWVAMDRGARIARYVRHEPDRARWQATANRIREEIYQRAFHHELGAFTQSYGSRSLDAANLLLPYYGFLPATDPKFLSTLAACEKYLVKNGFCFRYVDPDDFGTPQSAFLVCSFWLVDALFRSGERERAQEMFERLLSHANHLGLFSEDINIQSHELTGNFPQGYCHVAVINVANLLAGKSDPRAFATSYFGQPVFTSESAER